MLPVTFLSRWYRQGVDLHFVGVFGLRPERLDTRSSYE